MIVFGDILTCFVKPPRLAAVLIYSSVVCHCEVFLTFCSNGYSLSQTAKSLGSTLIRYRSDTLDRYLIDIDSRVFAIWRVFCELSSWKWLGHHLYLSCVALNFTISLQWRHNGHDSVSNHQPHDCLLNHLFKPRSKKTSRIPRTNGQ